MLLKDVMFNVLLDRFTSVEPKNIWNLFRVEE